MARFLVVLPQKNLIMRILHILDDSIPLHSGYAFRSLALLTEQRRLGWETLHLTTPKQGQTETDEEVVDGWTFYRTQPTANMIGIRVIIREMAATHARIEELVSQHQPDILIRTPLFSMRFPPSGQVVKLGLPVVYEMRASGRCSGRPWHDGGRQLALQTLPRTRNLGFAPGLWNHHNLRRIARRYCIPGRH